MAFHENWTLHEDIKLNYKWSRGADMYEYEGPSGYRYVDKNSGGGVLSGYKIRGKSFGSLLKADAYLKKMVFTENPQN